MASRAHLPPVGIILVYNLEQVPSSEAQASFFAGDEAVTGRVIVKVAFHKHLGQGARKSQEAEEGWKGHASLTPRPPSPMGVVSHSPPSAPSLTKMTEALATAPLKE